MRLLKLKLLSEKTEKFYQQTALLTAADPLMQKILQPGLQEEAGMLPRMFHPEELSVRILP